MKISVITVVEVIDDLLEGCCKSIVDQEFNDFEHIVVHHGFLDQSSPLLDEYGHLNLISMPDANHEEALARGLSASQGELISCLGPACRFKKGTFSSVVMSWETDTRMIIGKVKVREEKTDSTFVNDPKIDLDSMLHHWEPDSFCINPLGFFFHKELLDQIEQKPGDGYKHNLKFLLEASSLFPGQIKKLNRIFGDAIKEKNSTNSLEEESLEFWNPLNFSFLDSFLESKPAEYKKEFKARQACGYQVKRTEIIRKAMTAGEVFSEEENCRIHSLPGDEFRINPHTAFAENEYAVAEGDSLVCVLTAGKVGSKSIIYGMRDLPAQVSAYPVFHLHSFRDNLDQIIQNYTCNRLVLGHLISGHMMHKIWMDHGSSFTWKCIVGVRDPIAWILSSIFENDYGFQFTSRDDFYKGIYLWEWVSNYFDRQYKEVLGVDIYTDSFNKEKGYTIVRKGNVEILLYTLERLNDLIEEAMLSFLGIPGFKLKKSNSAEEKPYKKSYKKALLLLERSFSADEVEQFYSHKVATHFYTPERIEEFKKRWMS